MHKKEIKYTREYFVIKGRAGGNATLKSKGLKHFKVISKKAVKARKLK